MVLVSCGLDNYIGILQTKFSYREGHEARRIRLEAMPLNQHVEGGHGKREARLKIPPAPVHDLFEMAHERQHGEHRLDEHTVLPLTALTQLEGARIALRRMEGRITQDYHVFFALPNQPLKGVIRDIGGRKKPRRQHAPSLYVHTHFA